MKKYLLFIMMMTVMFFSVTLAAEEDEDSLLLGIGIMSESGIYKDISGDTEPAPILMGQYGNWWIDGTTIGYNLYESEDFAIAPVVSFSLDGGYDPVDADNGSQLYKDLSSLDGATEIGFVAEVEIGPIEVEFSYLTDASSTHDGDLFGISIGEIIPFMGGRLEIEPSIGLTRTSKDYNQYYYGITPSQANALRKAYDASSGINYELAVFGKYQLSRKFYLLGRVAFEKFDSELLNSPLVDDDSETSIGLGIAYEF